MIWRATTPQSISRKEQQHLRVNGSGISFEAIERSIQAADMVHHLPGDVGGVEQGELPSSLDSEVRADVASQHFIPSGCAPLLPLTLGQSHGDRTGLENTQPSSPLGDAPLDQSVNGNTQVVAVEVAPQCGNHR